MTDIKHSIIIYNPNSTGDGKKNAQQLQVQLEQHTDISAQLLPTEYAGHAEAIVKAITTTQPTLVVSSSGDGGYHELINGIMTTENKESHLIAGLLPSGNANDHYNAVHDGDLLARIKAGDVRSIDVLKVSTDNWTRYAHSYIGIGLSPHIGEKLTEATLNLFSETWLVIRHFFTSSPVKIRVNGVTRRYDSLIFSTINRMSKYMTLSKNAKIDDGIFEINSKRSGTLIMLIAHLFKASTVGLTDDAMEASTYSFRPARRLAIQMDGEVFHIDANTQVTVTIEPKALACIV